MSKARDDTSVPNKTVKKGRYWVHNTTKPPHQVEEAKPRKRQRFVEPYRLSDEQRSAILVPLKRLGIGDEETRSLFSAAMEYDLASCHNAAGRSVAVVMDSKPDLSPDEVSLSPLHDAARDLAERLKTLDETSKARLQQSLKETDRFRRTYDDEYFSVLRYELLRLAAVAKPAEQPNPPPAEPATSEAAQRFIVRAADAFEECFDIKATARVSGPFLLTLKAIATATGIQIPTDAGSIAQLLKTT